MRCVIVALASAASSAAEEAAAFATLTHQLQHAYALLEASATADEAPALHEMADGIKQLKQGTKPLPVSALAGPPKELQARLQRAKAKLEYMTKHLEELRDALPMMAARQMQQMEASHPAPDMSKVQEKRAAVMAALDQYKQAQATFQAKDHEAAGLVQRVHEDRFLTAKQRDELLKQLEPQGKAALALEQAAAVEHGVAEADAAEKHLRQQALVEEGAELQAMVDSAGTLFLGGEHTSPIPKVLWTPHLEDKALAEWEDRNPGFKVMQMSERDMDRFMSVETDEKTYQVFRTVPLAEMRRDLWRYAAMYKIGGVYAHAGASAGAVPVQDWFKPSSWMQGMGCKVVLGLDSPGTGYVVHNSLAAAPGQPVFKQALESAVQRVGADGGVDQAKPHFAEYYTGAGVFTDALKQTTGVRESLCPTDPDGHSDDGSGGRVLNSCLYNAAVDELRRQKLCLQDEGFYSTTKIPVQKATAAGKDFVPLWDGHETWDSLPRHVPPAAPHSGSSISDMLDFVKDTDED